MIAQVGSGLGSGGSAALRIRRLRCSAPHPVSSRTGVPSTSKARAIVILCLAAMAPQMPRPWFCRPIDTNPSRRFVAGTSLATLFPSVSEGRMTYVFGQASVGLFGAEKERLAELPHAALTVLERSAGKYTLPPSSLRPELGRVPLIVLFLRADRSRVGPRARPSGGPSSSLFSRPPSITLGDRPPDLRHRLGRPESTRSQAVLIP